jgi:hypothetical protein
MMTKEGNMFHGKARRIVAALVGAAMLTAPASAWAGDYCSTYHQVASHSTGGDYVGGLLSYETMGSVTRNDGGETVAVTLGSGTPVATTITVTSPGDITTTQEPIGTYDMNDGTVWQVNCLTGAATKVG